MFFRRNFRPHFAKFSFNFRSIKIEIFLFRIKKIVLLQHFNEFREKFKWISQTFQPNFANFVKKFTKIFVFVHIFVGLTKFSRKRLRENLETLSGVQYVFKILDDFSSLIMINYDIWIIDIWDVQIVIVLFCKRNNLSKFHNLSLMHEFALQGLKADLEHESHVGFPANETFREKMGKF